MSAQISPEAADLLAGIRTWVEIESHTPDVAGVNALADRISADYAACGAEVTRVAGTGYGDHLIVRAPWGGQSNTPGVLIISHMDTVHPKGTLETFPFRVEGDIAFGPGIYDMKGGAYCAMRAVSDLAAAEGAPLPVTHLFVADEEVGSPTSKDLIIDLAKAAKYVLVTEPAREGGKIVTARKGAVRYDVTTHGEASHAGSRHQDGQSAIREMAHTVLKFENLTDYNRGTTCNVGLINGGTGTNVVPAKCWVKVDIRIADMDALKEVEEFVAALTPENPNVRLEINGGLDRPPYERDAGIDALFDLAKTVAKDIGWELESLKTGGGSDGNFTAQYTPTLDGLGVDGKGGHTDYEQLKISSLQPRRLLMRGILEGLT
ncbi:M20 family metallopeptidase [Alphaproteobacteria bacterium KMM 3653]|uniref:M20 family metallopeptidase n=1 Tax=Harenicola maris TaxID=2841044 RepID=A0AAP2CPW6_9RHOB|nr:M20 family metallopeptidase [Harenicola maris]